MKYFFLSLILFSSKFNIKAQTIDTVLKKMTAEYASEKVFIHFDKAAYNKGETIWFKTYIVDGNLPSVFSKNFYADWYSESGELIKHDMYPIFLSSTKGQFNIPENYTGKSLHVKAYTRWMLNFDTAFLFNKYITVIQKTTPTTLATIEKTIVNFFPEGGDIINGVASFVAFKSTNQYGLPVKISGVVKNSLGEFIDSIKTEHDGMGSVYIDKPNIQHQYIAYYKSLASGETYENTLPLVAENSVAMQVQLSEKFAIVTITRSDTVTDDKKYVKLYGIVNDQVVYKADIKLAHKTFQTLQIKTSELPTGIVQFTLLNANEMPLAERIVFVKNNNYSFEAIVNSTVKNIDKRAKNVLEINVPDTLLSNLSIAVTDVNTAYDTGNNIYSQLLLCGDIKGKVFNPAYYFTKDNDTIQQHLDLVMLTNGWRRYNWTEITKGRLPYIKYKRDSSYAQLIGNSYGLDKSDLVLKPEIFLLMQGKDSSKRQLILPLAKNGSFIKPNFIFYDTVKVFYTFLGSNKLNRIGEVSFQNGLFNTPSKNNIDSIIMKYSNVDYAFIEKQRKLDEEYKRLVNVKGSGFLDEVTVKTKAKSSQSILDEKYTSSIFSGGDAYQFDLLNDNRAASSISVFNYLQGMVGGLQITQQGGETVVKWRQAETDFYLNEIRTDAEVIGSISMNDIAYIKVFRPPFFGGALGSPGGAIAVYTRKGGDEKSTPGKGLPFKFVEGYTTYKEFYNVNYEKENEANKPDFRTTLYWNPYILTDESTKKIKVEFYNNDVTKKFRVVLCGMNTEGKLTWLEKIIE